MTENDNSFERSVERVMNKGMREIKNNKKLTEVRRDIITNTIVLEITPKILEMISDSVLKVCHKNDTNDFERLCESVVYSLHDLASKSMQDLENS